jgi:hypothetical protein
MREEDWDAKEFVERMVAGDGNMVDMLADLSPDQLIAVELILVEKGDKWLKETGPLTETMQRDKVQR